jgi:hypothetical protein
LRDGLLSPPDSARSARALAMQEFRRQPGAVCALELQAQMSAQLEAAEAKLHVHRTAASKSNLPCCRQATQLFDWLVFLACVHDHHPCMQMV